MIKLIPLATTLRELDSEIQDLREHSVIADIAEELNLLANIMWERVEKIEKILEDINE